MTPEAQKPSKTLFSFSEIDIPIGSILVFSKDAKIQCKVYSDNEVVYDGKVTSLSGAGLDAVRRCGYKWKRIAGPDFWLYDDLTLNQIKKNKKNIN